MLQTIPDVINQLACATMQVLSERLLHFIFEVHRIKTVVLWSDMLILLNVWTILTMEAIQVYNIFD